MTEDQMVQTEYCLGKLETIHDSFLRCLAAAPYSHSKLSSISLMDGAITASVFGHAVTVTTRKVRKASSDEVDMLEYVFSIMDPTVIGQESEAARLPILTLGLDRFERLYDVTLGEEDRNATAIIMKNSYVGRYILEMLASKVFDSKVFKSTY
jgi:hypothetical protein